jgi:amidophosphoribosyltransferase
MCGVVAIYGKYNVNQAIFDSLTVLQHRGQDAAGIVTADGSALHMRKAKGLANEVIRTRHMMHLKGNLGIGHVRYPTAGSFSELEAQPFYVNSPYGITLAHNGNLTNAEELKSILYQDDLRHLITNSDSEILLNVLAHELQKSHKLHPTAEDIFQAVKKVHERVRGSYAVVAMITNVGILAFRDPNGIRPLVYGKRKTELGTEYMIASESVALDAQNFKVINDVQPGEAVFIDLEGNCFTQQCSEKAKLHPCLFEFVYLARPDSFLDKISVYKVRMSIGRRLGQKILREWGNHDIDKVIPVPETARHAALTLANEIGVKFREGLVKNRYIGRTFIMPGQKARKKSVSQKLNAINLEFKGKNVLLVDDSIVRGTTCKEIIQMARDAGARKVYFASAAPPVRYPNIYGIDMPVAEELIAHNKTIEEIQTLIGADKLIYLDLDDLKEAVREGNSDINQFEASVFDGHYITGNEEAYLKRASALRNNAAKEDEDVEDAGNLQILNRS